MTKNAEGVLLKKSKLTTNGKPNLPAPSKLVEGELAINYAEGVETISTKNESGTVVTFSSDDYYTAKKLGSGFTGVNSARTVTDAIVNADWDEEDETSGAFIKNKPFGETCEYVTGYESTFTAVQTGPNDYGIGNWSFSGDTSWKHGDTYRVTINDDVYVTNAVYFAGDNIGLNMEEGAENPFTDTWSIYKDINFGNFLSSKQIALGDTVYLKVEQLVCTVKQIENKYLDTPWEKGEDVGSAKIVANSGITSGAFAISEGHATSAITEGTYGGAHAEGLATLASGNCTHAEGCTTSAMTQGMPGGAHAEGVSTLASGQGAHAEGSSTSAITSSPGAHAEGSNTLAYSQGAHAEGINCIASGMSTHAEGYATSAMTNGMPTAHAEGYETLASFGCAHAEGGYTRATAQYSHAEGERTSATTVGAHAEGTQTQAKGYYSHAEGGFTITNGYYAHAEGYQTSATTSYTHAEGYATLASEYYTHAEGSSTRATGQYAHAEGYATSATTSYTHAEGYGSIASGQSSHAEGQNTLAGGRYGSHAEGYNTKATAEYNSHAEGYESIATGNYGSHAEGYESIASSYSSHAEGCATSAASYYSHSEGYHTLASGQSSHAEGYETVANGNYSHTEGYNTIANNYFEHASGVYNVSNKGADAFGNSGNTLFSVGNGNASARHNAFEIRQNGDIYIINKDGNDVKLQDEIGNIDVDQVLDETTSASTNPVATKAVYDVYHEFETVVSAAINDLETKKLEESDVDQTIDSTTSASTNPISTSGVYDFVTSYTPSITVDQVLDDTTSASTNPVSSKAVYDAVTDNEMVWANAYVAISGAISSHTEDTDVHVTLNEKTAWNGAVTDSHTHSNKSALDSITGNVGTMAYEAANSYSSATEVGTALGNKLEASDVADFFDDAKYEDSGTTKVINFYHGNTIKATIDASDFIVDGMVDDVRIENGNLVIDFNTASGKQDISIPLTDIFDPSNYYNKTAIDNLVGSGFTSSSITDVIIENEEITSAALTDLNTNKLDVTAYTPVDLSNYYTKSETSGASEISTALSDKASQSDLDTLSGTVTSHTASINDLSGQSETIAAALVDLNENKLDVTAYTPTDLSNYYTKSQTSGASEISTALSGKSDTGHTHSQYLTGITSSQVTTALGFTPANSTAFTAHTADTTVHVTSSEKSTWNGKANSATTLAGYGITNAYTKSEIDAMIGNIETLLAAI